IGESDPDHTHSQCHGFRGLFQCDQPGHDSSGIQPLESQQYGQHQGNSEPAHLKVGRSHLVLTISPPDAAGEKRSPAVFCCRWDSLEMEKTPQPFGESRRMKPTMKPTLVAALILVSTLSSAKEQVPPTLKSVLLAQLKTTHNSQDWFVPVMKAV